MAIPSSTASWRRLGVGNRPAYAIAFGLVVAVTGCTLVVDTTGLVGGDAAGESVGDASTFDQRAPVTSDGGRDAPGYGGGSDAGLDTGPPCTVTCSESNAAGSACSGGSCSYTCSPGFGDCNAEAGSNTDGCETPITTITNCGACGAACDTVTGAPTCGAGSSACSYACKSDRADCDQSGSNTNGCECATPMCCGAGCATTHSDGVGETFYDCTDAGAPTLTGALAACAAYTHDPSVCSGDWTCSGVSTVSVCYQLSDGGCGDYCWNYSGANNGIVTDCSCPGGKIGPWN